MTTNRFTSAYRTPRYSLDFIYESVPWNVHEKALEYLEMTDREKRDKWWSSVYFSRSPYELDQNAHLLAMMVIGREGKYNIKIGRIEHMKRVDELKAFIGLSGLLTDTAIAKAKDQLHQIEQQSKERKSILKEMEALINETAKRWGIAYAFNARMKGEGRVCELICYDMMIFLRSTNPENRVTNQNMRYGLKRYGEELDEIMESWKKEIEENPSRYQGRYVKGYINNRFKNIKKLKRIVGKIDYPLLRAIRAEKTHVQDLMWLLGLFYGHEWNDKLILLYRISHDDDLYKKIMRDRRVKNPTLTQKTLKEDFQKLVIAINSI